MAEAGPLLTVIVVVHDMRREAARTLFALTPRCQLGVRHADYEVRVLDHGSRAPLDAASVEAMGPNFHYRFIDTDRRSPCQSINEAVADARTPCVAVMIDGARIPSPGILQGFLQGMAAAPDALVYTLGMHLGDKLQNKAMLHGYDQAAEDVLLQTVPWQRDGYRLFDIAVTGGSYGGGYLGSSRESNFLCLRRETWLALGGLDERFTSPGGGLANLEFFNRLQRRPGLLPILLLGEASFHQFHGGVATNAPVSPWAAMAAEYERIVGAPYRPYWRPPLLLGQLRAGSAALSRPMAEFHAGVPVLAVLGMHRSGTSCLAGMLQAAGFASGTVNDYARNNRRGNREDPAIVALNDRLLSANGAAWDDPPPIDAPLLVDEAQRRSRARILEAAAAHKRPWMFKDPRTLLALPLWREALPNPRRLGIFRHPLRVAQSLYYRAQGQQAIARGLALWTRYNEALLREHERAAFPVVCFDLKGADFIAAVAQALREECGDLVDAGRIDLARLAEFYDPGEVHQQDLLDAGALDDDPAAREVLARARALYERLRRLAGIDDARAEPAASAALRAEYAQLQAVDAAVRAGDLPRALTLCRALAAASPNRAQLWWRMVHIAKSRKDDAALVEVCREAIAGLPDDPGLRLELAGALRQSGQPAPALEAVDEALALRPGWGQAQLMRGMALNALGRAAEAVEAFRAGAVTRSDNPWLLTPYAGALLRSGQQDDAAEAFRQALVRNPPSTHALIHQKWAQALAATGHLDAACAQFELAVAAAGPRRAEFAQAFARLLQRHGRDQEARQWLAGTG